MPLLSKEEALKRRLIYMRSIGFQERETMCLNMFDKTSRECSLGEIMVVELELQKRREIQDKIIPKDGYMSPLGVLILGAILSKMHFFGGI